MVTAVRPDHVITRNASFFKKLNEPGIEVNNNNNNIFTPQPASRWSAEALWRTIDYQVYIKYNYMHNLFKCRIQFQYKPISFLIQLKITI